MPYIDPEVIAEAKKMDLLTYLQNYEPQELIRFSGDTYCTRTHDSLKISNGKWNWFSQGVGGRSALDYLIKVNGMTFIDAVERITGRAAAAPPVVTSMTREQPKEAVFKLPPRDCSLSMLERYLHKRGISDGAIHYCTENGLAYQNYRNDYYNAVFVGRDLSGIPRFATIRGISSNFKGDVPGSDKSYSFSISNSGSEKLHLFESAIDLLSFASFQEVDGISNRFYEDMLSLSGVYKPRQDVAESALPPALKQYLADHPRIRQVHLHLDNDLAGRQAAQAIMAALPKEYEAKDEPPPSGKDWNDYRCDCLHISRCNSKERSDAR